jgi:nicotinamidase-related amidase
MDPSARDLTVHYYRQYPIDPEAEHPADGFRGWATSAISVPREETALIVMHVWNLGLDDRLPWPEADPAIEAQIATCEWIRRYRADLPQMERALESARAAGLPVCHIAALPHYAEAYPAYQRNVTEAGPEPPRPPGAPAGEGWVREQLDLAYGEGYWGQMPALHARLDLAPTMRPKDGEGVCVTTHQLNHWSRQRGISNLIYVGFAINWCLWFSPCGMVDMRRLGYRCFAVEDATTTVEYGESVATLANKRAAMWRVSLMFGYVLRLAEMETWLGQS